MLGHIIPSDKGFSVNAPSLSAPAECPEGRGSITLSMAYLDAEVLGRIKVLAVSHVGEGNPPAVHEASIEDLGGGLTLLTVNFVFYIVAPPNYKPQGLQETGGQ